MSAVKKIIVLSENGSLLTILTSYLKAQLSAFIGGVVDFGVMVILTEVFGVHYLYSLVAGGLIGAFFNFIINRYWTFAASGSELWQQVIKFSIAAIISIALKSAGTYLLTEFILLDYKISRLITDAFVGLVVNYLIQRFWVFK